MQNIIYFDFYKESGNTSLIKKIVICFYKRFNIIRKTNEVFLVYVREKINENKEEYNKNQEKILKKIDKKISKINNKNIVLSKEIKCDFENLEKINKENKNNVNKIKRLNNIYNLIQRKIENKDLYKEKILEILNRVILINKEVPEEQSIYILSKAPIQEQKIFELTSKYKMINIVTPNLHNYEKIENRAEENGDMVIITNNMKKSIIRAKYVINIDFSQTEIEKYNINRKLILFNETSSDINIKNFDGVIINNIRINDDCEDRYSIQEEYIYNKNNMKISSKINKKIYENKYDFIGKRGVLNLKDLLLTKEKK